MSGHVDIDAILAEEERVTCVFSVDAAELGYLDPSGENGDDLAANARVDLPLWMARAVAAKNMVQIETPKQYGLKIRDDILASATALRLRERSAYYFQFGLYLARILGDNDLLRTLRYAFTGDRYRHVLDWSFNSRNEDMTDPASGLTHSELVIFEAGRESSREYSEWQRGLSSRLKASSVMARIAKQQRLQDEQQAKRARVAP